MMKIGVIVLLLICANVYAQDDIRIAEVRSVNNSSRHFVFSHNVEYFEMLEQRLLNYSNREKAVIRHISIKNGVCEVVFHEAISEEERNNTLLFLAQGLSYQSFKLSEE